MHVFIYYTELLPHSVIENSDVFAPIMFSCRVIIKCTLPLFLASLLFSPPPSVMTYQKRLKKEYEDFCQNSPETMWLDDETVMTSDMYVKEHM